MTRERFATAIAIAVASSAIALLARLSMRWSAERSTLETTRVAVAAQRDRNAKREVLERFVHDSASQRARGASLLRATSATTAVTELASIIRAGSPAQLESSLQIVAEDDTVRHGDLHRVSVRLHVAGATGDLAAFIQNLLSDSVQLRLDPLRLEGAASAAGSGEPIGISMDAGVSAWYTARAR